MTIADQSKTSLRPEDNRASSAPLIDGLRAFVAICAQWQLTPAERMTLLAVPSQDRYNHLLRQARLGQITLNQEQLFRISATLGIWKTLSTLFSDADQARDWFVNANAGAIFLGQSPRQRLTSASLDDLGQIWRHLTTWSDGLTPPSHA